MWEHVHIMYKLLVFENKNVCGHTSLKYFVVFLMQSF